MHVMARPMRGVGFPPPRLCIIAAWMNQMTSRQGGSAPTVGAIPTASSRYNVIALIGFVLVATAQVST
jgi:hypothetical protein